mgnify:FL=1
MTLLHDESNADVVPLVKAALNDAHICYKEVVNIEEIPREDWTRRVNTAPHGVIILGSIANSKCFTNR